MNPDCPLDPKLVIPAQAGIQFEFTTTCPRLKKSKNFFSRRERESQWIPAYAGMTLEMQ